MARPYNVLAFINTACTLSIKFEMADYAIMLYVLTN